MATPALSTGDRVVAQQITVSTTVSGCSADLGNTTSWAASPSPMEAFDRGIEPERAKAVLCDADGVRWGDEFRGTPGGYRIPDTGRLRGAHRKIQRPPAVGWSGRSSASRCASRTAASRRGAHLSPTSMMLLTTTVVSASTLPAPGRDRCGSPARRRHVESITAARAAAPSGPRIAGGRATRLWMDCLLGDEHDRTHDHRHFGTCDRVPPSSAPWFGGRGRNRHGRARSATHFSVTPATAVSLWVRCGRESSPERSRGGRRRVLRGPIQHDGIENTCQPRCFATWSGKYRASAELTVGGHRRLAGYQVCVRGPGGDGPHGQVHHLVMVTGGQRPPGQRAQFGCVSACRAERTGSVLLRTRRVRRTNLIE